MSSIVPHDVTILDYSFIAHDLANEYCNYCKMLEKMMIDYCESDENIGKLVSLMFSIYEKGTKEYYMSQGINDILEKIYKYNSPFGLVMRNNNEIYHMNNTLERILNFIGRYIHVDEEVVNSFPLAFEYDDYKLIGIKLTFDENCDIIVKENRSFYTRREMESEGFFNSAEKYLEFLEMYAEKKMK